MRIGIIGATGFIGSALAREAVQRGCGVVVFSRRKDVFLPWAKEIRPVEPKGRVIDPSGLDALVNLAGENVFGLWTAGKRRRIRESRIEFTNRIVDALQETRDRPGVFISASATGFYGDRGDEVLSEDSSRGCGFLSDVCVDWEAAADRAIKLGVRVVRIRTGVVLGEGGGAWPMLRRVFKLNLGSRLGGGRQFMPWIHLDDQVNLILHTLEKSAYAGAVNLTAPNPVSNAELTAAIARALGKRTFLPAPALALKLMLGEFSSTLLGSQRVQPKSALTRAFAFRHPTLEDALSALTGG